jgi:hypothetical protein
MRTHWEQQKSHHPPKTTKEKKNLGFDRHVVSLPLAARDFLPTSVFCHFGPRLMARA